MSIRTASSQPLSQTVSSSIDQMANGAEHAVQNLRDRVSPTASRLASQAEDLAHRGVHAVRERTDQLRERASYAGDVSTQFVKDQPVKAVLIAAAAGALIVALLSLGRSSREGRTYRN
jgi:ElaB/YqjD/DUF883 family membrane-anchored ribosome-binding protein